MAKLHIPAPSSPDDRGDMYLAILLYVGLTGFAAYGFLHMKPPEAKQTVEGGPAAHVETPTERKFAAEEALTRRLGKMSDAELGKVKWNAHGREAVLRFGPRRVAEKLCDTFRADLAAGKLDGATKLDLEKALDRRALTAPWTCMTRSYLQGKLPDGDLKKEMDEFWGELEKHDGDVKIIASVLADIRKTRDRPKNPKFWSWARMCALDTQYAAAPACRELLYQVSPAQGADMLGVVEKQWQATGERPEDMPIIIQALGLMARQGQPAAWDIKETKELPDYNVDFKQAAVGYLCRLENTPTLTERKGTKSPFDKVPVLAADELRKVGLVGARAYEDRLLLRWRETCRLGFGGQGGYEGKKYIPVPLLAVWNGDPKAEPDYRLGTAVSRGLCKVREGYPQWYCLSSLWRGQGKPLDEAVAHFFVETRYMEWDDQFATAQPDAGILN